MLPLATASTVYGEERLDVAPHDQGTVKQTSDACREILDGYLRKGLLIL